MAASHSFKLRSFRVFTRCYRALSELRFGLPGSKLGCAFGGETHSAELAAVRSRRKFDYLLAVLAHVTSS